MRTLLVGLDAASDRKNFGWAIGAHGGARIEIRDAGCLGDARAVETIAAALRGAKRALVAIDAPLGWPDGLRDALREHRAGEPLAHEKHAMFRRATDRRLRLAEHGAHRPLEVGADRIARAAHEALSVLRELRKRTALALPLAWTPAFAGAAAIEVYPAATLRAHGIAASGYKKPEQRGARERIAAALAARIPALRDRCAAQADVFDACLCLVAAADFLDGRCAAPPPELAAAAAREGWIWVADRAAAASTSTIAR